MLLFLLSAPSAFSFFLLSAFYGSSSKFFSFHSVTCLSLLFFSSCPINHCIILFLFLLWIPFAVFLLHNFCSFYSSSLFFIFFHSVTCLSVSVFLPFIWIVVSFLVSFVVLIPFAVLFFKFSISGGSRNFLLSRSLLPFIFVCLRFLPIIILFSFL